MRKLDAGGDTWQVTSGGLDERAGVRTFVFHCLSNTQRPYRVVEVPEPLISDRSVDGIADGELADLFDRTHIMDYVHDRDAYPEGHGVRYE